MQRISRLIEKLSDIASYLCCALCLSKLLHSQRTYELLRNKKDYYFDFYSNEKITVKSDREFGVY